MLWRRGRLVGPMSGPDVLTRHWKCGTLPQGASHMAHRILLSVAVLLILAAGAQSAPKDEPKECPIADSDLDKIEEAARTAPSCDKALEVFGRCGSGASSDVALGGIVTEKCEADFLKSLSQRERRAYAKARQRCERKYRNKTGSMYRSAEAYCVAEVARDHARRHAKRQGARRP